MNHKGTYCIIQNLKRILQILIFIIITALVSTLFHDIILFRDVRKISLCNKASSFNFFAITLTMDAIIVAIIVFLYSHYKEETFGVPTEFIVKYIIGDNLIALYKILIFVIPCISLICDIMSLKYTCLACIISMYVIVGVFSYIITSMMRRDIVKTVIHNMLSDEIEERIKEFQKSKILTPTIDGYKKERSVERDIYFHEKLKSKLIEIIFQTQCSGQELREIIEEVFRTIIMHRNKCPVIGFIFTYDLALGILNLDTNKDSCFFWNLDILKSLINTLDKELYQLERSKKAADNKSDNNKENKKRNVLKFIKKIQEKGEIEKREYIKLKVKIKEKEKSIHNESYYLDIYIAIIYALLMTKDKAAENFLWLDFYANSKQRNNKITKKMFVATVLFIQVLLVNNYPNFDLFFKLVKENTDSFRRAFINYNSVLDLKKYGFLISLIGVCSHSEAISVLEIMEQDFSHVCEREYVPNTIFLSFLNRREN